MVQLSHLYMTIGKTKPLTRLRLVTQLCSTLCNPMDYSLPVSSIHGTRQTFVGKVMSLLLNMLFRLVIDFLPRSKHLLISWLHSPSAVILEPKKIKSLTVSIVSHLFAMKWWDQMPWSLFSECFLNEKALKPTFSLSSFTFIKRLFSYSSLCAIRVVSSAYLKLLIFLLAILIPACASSSPTFHDVLCIEVK